METAHENRNIALIILAVMITLTALGLAAVRPPAAVGIDAPPTEFASGRAVQHLERIAAASSPIGTERHKHVQQYLIAQLEELGLEPQIQAVNVYNPSWRNAGFVENIAVKILGTNSTKAVLLIAHYDTLDQVPGASNPKSGVAAILEVLRILQQEEQLQNDLIVLFADGGETGLLGATAFLGHHPWAEDVGLVINPAARGTSGPVMMTDSTRDNSWTIPEFAEAVARPLANSFNNEINRWLVSDTDFVVFKYAGIPGFQLMYGETERHYQTALDNLDNLDERSLQHLGSYIYQLVKHFGNIEIEVEESNVAANYVYFDLFGRLFIRYPIGWVAHTLTFAIILFGFTCWYAVKREKAEAKGIALGVVLMLGAVLISAVITTVLGGFVTPNHDFYQYIPPTQGLLYFTALAAVTALNFFVFYTWALNKYRLMDLYLGALGLWLLVTMLASLLLTGASYAFVWPLIFNLAAALVVVFRKQLSWVTRIILLVISALPVLLLWPNLLKNLYFSIGYGLLGLLIFFVVLLLGTLLPQWEKIMKWQKLVLPIIAAAAAAVCFGIVIANSGVSADNPKMDTLFYFVDLDRERAYWVSLDAEPDEFTEQVFGSEYIESDLGEFIPYEDMPTISRLAVLDESLSSEPFTLELVSDTANEEKRELTINIKTDETVNNIIIFIEPELVTDTVVLNGETEVEWNSYWPVLRCYNLNEEGVTLAVPTAVGQPFVVKILAQTLGMPEIGLKSRPEHIIPAPTAITDSTFISKSFQF
jgi:hypothetical protein